MSPISVPLPRSALSYHLPVLALFRRSVGNWTHRLFSSPADPGVSNRYFRLVDQTTGGLRGKFRQLFNKLQAIDVVTCSKLLYGLKFDIELAALTFLYKGKAHVAYKSVRALRRCEVDLNGYFLTKQHEISAYYPFVKTMVMKSMNPLLEKKNIMTLN